MMFDDSISPAVVELFDCLARQQQQQEQVDLASNQNLLSLPLNTVVGNARNLGVSRKQLRTVVTKLNYDLIDYVSMHQFARILNECWKLHGRGSGGGAPSHESDADTSPSRSHKSSPPPVRQHDQQLLEQHVPTVVKHPPTFAKPTLPPPLLGTCASARPQPHQDSGTRRLVFEATNASTPSSFHPRPPSSRISTATGSQPPRVVHNNATDCFDFRARLATLGTSERDRVLAERLNVLGHHVQVGGISNLAEILLSSISVDKLTQPQRAKPAVKAEHAYRSAYGKLYSGRTSQETSSSKSPYSASTPPVVAMHSVRLHSAGVHSKTAKRESELARRSAIYNRESPRISCALALDAAQQVPHVSRAFASRLRLYHADLGLAAVITIQVFARTRQSCSVVLTKRGSKLIQRVGRGYLRSRKGLRLLGDTHAHIGMKDLQAIMAFPPVAPKVHMPHSEGYFVHPAHTDVRSRSATPPSSTTIGHQFHHQLHSPTSHSFSLHQLPTLLTTKSLKRITKERAALILHTFFLTSAARWKKYRRQQKVDVMRRRDKLKDHAAVFMAYFSILRTWKVLAVKKRRMVLETSAALIKRQMRKLRNAKEFRHRKAAIQQWNELRVAEELADD